MPRIGEVLAELTAQFTDAGLDSARLDARVLMAHVLGLDAARLFARAYDEFPEDKLLDMLLATQRRINREPVSRIRGTREFWGLDFRIDAATLDPRPDTETLVEAAVKLRVTGNVARIVDLGVGSGAILLAILSEWPEAHGLGTDISSAALAVAADNAARLGLAGRAAFRVADWWAGVTERFDIIVSNPPYIATADHAGLAPEVALFDPVQALVGGDDGLEAYRRIVPQLKDHLMPGGTALLEVGQGQADAVAALLAAHELPHTAFYKDLSGIARVVAATA